LNDEPQVLVWSFGFRHCFVIRYSDFVIRGR
jgi:hypothetical protein